MAELEDRTAYVASLERYVRDTRRDVRRLVTERFSWDERFIKRKFLEMQQRSTDSSDSKNCALGPKNHSIEEKLLSSPLIVDSSPKNLSLRDSRRDSVAFKIIDTEKISRFERNISTSETECELKEIALKRDLKRRRTKYKISNKHPRYAEVLREIIDDQMKLLEPEKNDPMPTEKRQNFKMKRETERSSS